jgi:hypothetical protein
MTKKVLFFYLSLVTLVLLQIAATIYQTSELAHHGKNVALLHQQKQELLQEKMKLETAIFQESSLSNIMQSEAPLAYIEISQPLVITSSNTVALSQL